MDSDSENEDFDSDTSSSDEDSDEDDIRSSDSEYEYEYNPLSLLAIAGKKLLNLWTEDHLWLCTDEDESNEGYLPSNKEIYTVMTLGKYEITNTKYHLLKMCIPF